MQASTVWTYRQNRHSVVLSGNTYFIPIPHNIDIAKAICIVLVVIGHYKPSTSPAYWNTLVDIIYTFHMPLFMFASGFIYKQFTSPIYTLKQYSYFIKSKIHRLAIPYLATSTIIITIKIVMGHYITIDNPCTFNSYIEMLYQPSAGYFLWFLYVLFLIFIIIPIFQSRKSQTLLWFIALILFLLPLEFPHVFCLNQLKKYLLFFVSGIMLGNTKNILNYPIWHKYITIPILLLFINIIAVPLIDYTTSSFIQIRSHNYSWHSMGYSVYYGFRDIYKNIAISYC